MKVKKYLFGFGKDVGELIAKIEALEREPLDSIAFNKMLDKKEEIKEKYLKRVL